MKQIIILNGPPGCGKDTLANHLAAKYDHFHHLKFAHELKRITHRLYNTPDQEPDAYERFKDKPLTEFIGLTPRQAYINVSEHYIKRFHGADFFGLQLISSIKRIRDNNENVFVISDGGFGEELMPLLKAFGPPLITILQIHRPGFTFTGDSRQYLDKEQFKNLGVKFLVIDNMTSEKDFLVEAESLLSSTIYNLFDFLPTYNALLC
jgi:hypothetical protein